MLLAPDFSLQTSDLLIVFSAMISFLAFVWASKKLLDFLGLENLKLSIEARKQIKEEDRQSKITIKKQEYRKKEADKKEFKQRKKTEKKALKKYVKSQKAKQVAEKKQRAENGRVIHVKKRLEQKTPLAQRIPKSKSFSSSSKSKRTSRKEFMSKKYRNAMNTNLYAKYRY